MKINQDMANEEVQINIVSLIDVIFCILTFFLLAALQLTRQNAINIDLPKAATATPQMREMLVVSLDEVGQVYVEQQVMPSKEQLTISLKNYRATNPNGLIVLNAPRSATYDQVIQVLDFLREIGGDRVALATQIPSSNPQNPQNPQVPSNLNPGIPNPNVSPPPTGLNPSDPNNPGLVPNPNVNPSDPNNPGLVPNPNVNPSDPNNPGLVPNPLDPSNQNPTVPTVPTVPAVPSVPPSPSPGTQP